MFYSNQKRMKEKSIDRSAKSRLNIAVIDSNVNYEKQKVNNNNNKIRYSEKINNQ